MTGSGWFWMVASSIAETRKEPFKGNPRHKKASVPIMRDADCTAFLQWALPQLGMYWPGFRKVRHQVCKRLSRRISAIGLNGFAAYRKRLQADPPEWQVLDRCCHITISSFFRDRCMFDCLRTRVLPLIAERARLERRHARCWCAGCACGEEPYSLKILWDLSISSTCPGVGLSVIATDIDAALLGRARNGCYGGSSLREVPRELVARAFEQTGSRFRIRPQYREGVTFLNQDLRSEAPPDRFDIILCRNLAFTYFAPRLRSNTLAIIAERLAPNGFLVVGAREQLEDARFASAAAMPHILTRLG
jgi:chemotaxis protein methyltransferase CheR